MAVIGILTNVAKAKMIEASNNLGFTIIPNSFSVSDSKSFASLTLAKTQTDENASTWYSGSISSRVILSNDTVQINIQIPSGVTVGQKDIAEVCVFGKDIDDNDFLLAVGHTDPSDLYDPSGTTTLRLQFKVTNNDLSSLFTFTYTQAEEIAEHNIDPLSHPTLRTAIQKAGIYEQPGQHVFKGQFWDELATFEVGVVTGDVVYRTNSGTYEKALANNPTTEEALGVADVANSRVMASGFIYSNTSYTAGTKVYLSALSAGQVTDTPTNVFVGVVKDVQTILYRIANTDSIGPHIDVVCSDEEKYNHYSNLQTAIDNCPSGGWVRVEKLYEVVGPDPIDMNGKVVNLLFTGITSGVKKFLGLNDQQLITFSTVPTGGEFVLNFDGQKTARIPYTATNGDVETALENLSNITDVTVTGNFTNGFTIEFTTVDGLQNKTLILIGTELGVNAQQLMDFDNDDFDSGSIKFEHLGQTSVAIPFNQVTAENIETALNDLTTINTVTVIDNPSTPAGRTQFIISFQGVSGLQPQPLIIVPPADNSLEDSLSTPINVVLSNIVIGIKPDNTLTTTGTSVVVSSDKLVEGDIPGTTTGVLIDSDGCQLVGMGLIDGFSVGVDLQNHVSTRLEMNFQNTSLPIDATSTTTGSYNTHGSLGISLNDSQLEDVNFKNLARVVPDSPYSTITNVTSSEVTLSTGERQGLLVDQQVSSFGGGSINWATGEVTGGDDFVPYTALNSGYYYKYAVLLTIDSKIKVVPPLGEASSSALAPSPVIAGGLLRAIVVVQDDGLGGIENVTYGSIISYPATAGAFSQIVIEKEFSAPGGTDTFTLTEGSFNPNNEVLDIEVRINGLYRYQDINTNGNGHYAKISSTAIQFTEDVPLGATVTIKYVGSVIDHQSGSGTQVAFNVYEVTTDGINSDFTINGINFSSDNNIHDVEVIVEGIVKTLGKDFTKLSNEEIRFIDDLGDPFILPTGQTVIVRTREYSYGSTGGTINTGIGVQSEGIPLPNTTGILNFRGANVDVSQTTPGVTDIDVNTPEGENLGGGSGVYIDTLLGKLEFRSIRGIGGIIVTTVGDEIILSLGTAGFFRTVVTGVNTLSVSIGYSYDIGGKTLMYWLNGIRKINSYTGGKPIDRYHEATVTSVLLDDVSLSSYDHEFLNLENSSTYCEVITGISGTVFSVPSYNVSNNRLMVYKNGLLMTTELLGQPVDRFTKATTTTIELDQAITYNPTLDIREFLLVEYLGVEPNFRIDIGNFTGSTIDLSTYGVSYTVSNKKLLVFKNGILLPEDEYTQNSSTLLTLDTPANLTDWFAIIDLT